MNQDNDYRNWAYREYIYDAPPEDSFEPYPHQKGAWRALDKAKAPRRGLIVLPTGAGKTKAIVHWLMRRVLSEPDVRPILWLTHRAELIQQAARTFGEFYGVAKRTEPLKVRCISGAHGKSARALLKPVDINLCTIQSLISKNHEDRIREYFARNRDCVVVVDEAHHAAAASYQKILGFATRLRKVEIIGLTATPTRTVKAEMSRLKKIFRDEIIYQIGPSELIEKGILSRPEAHTVVTNFNFDRHLSKQEKKYLSVFQDIPPTILKKIAKHTARNKMIVNHYVSNKDEYQSTIVFSTGIMHCHTLAEEFNAQGVKADYVASAKAGDVPNPKVIQDFRDGKIDVLVNVAILTEGVDLPNINTVFLARPTGSEILMRQMIGRGMRGPKAGGQPDVHIVSFADHWERFPGWLDPMAFIDCPGCKVEDRKSRVRGEYLYLPWEILSAISALAPDIEPTAVFSTLPIGWYNLNISDPELGHATAVLVYEHQKAAFKEFLRAADQGEYVLSGRTGPSARYFADVPDPRPSDELLKKLAYYVRRNGRPRFISFEEKQKFDPEIIATKCRKKSVDEILKAAEDIYEKTLARSAYANQDAYFRVVMEALTRQVNKEALPVDAPRYQGPGRKKLPPPTRRSLLKLRDQVRKEMKLKEKAPNIRWSKAPMSSAWGLYRASDKNIIINNVLNTKAVEVRTLKFLIYHELLHHELGVEEGHSRYFREQERMFVGYADAEAQLDTLGEEYYVPGMAMRSSKK